MGNNNIGKIALTAALGVTAASMVGCQTPSQGYNTSKQVLTRNASVKLSGQQVEVASAADPTKNETVIQSVAKLDGEGVFISSAEDGKMLAKIQGSKGEVYCYEGVMNVNAKVLDAATATADRTLFFSKEAAFSITQLQVLSAADFQTKADAAIAVLQSSNPSGVLTGVFRAPGFNPNDPTSSSLTDSMDGTQTLRVRNPALIPILNTGEGYNATAAAVFLEALRKRLNEESKPAAEPVQKTSAVWTLPNGQVAMAVRSANVRARA